MSVAAEDAVRAWLNGRAIVTGQDGPLAGGAFLAAQASPAYGAYAVLARQAEGVPPPVAEDGQVTTARMQFEVYAGTIQASEAGAAALRGELEKLTGAPQPCGATGVRLRVADNLTGPAYVPQEAGETFLHVVGADLVLTG